MKYQKRSMSSKLMISRLSIFVWLLLLCTGCQQESEPIDLRGSRPNIILIVADDLGVNDLACYGNEFIETEHLDRLAAAGLLCTNGYAAAPLCSPTRASIQSGLHPARIGMTEHIRGHPPARPWMKVIPPKSTQGLDSTIHTLPKLFAEADYKTGHIGKWHLGGGPCMPEAHGYDLNFAGNWAGLPKSFYYPFFWEGVHEQLKSYAKEGDYLTDVLTDRALEFVDENKEGKFFLHLAYYSPHVPIEAKENWLRYYQEKRAPAADSLLPNVHYAAMVSSIDENVGRIVSHLDSLGLLDSTLIIFTSDNGGLSVREVPGFDKHTPPTDNMELRDGKGYLSEGGIKEPFIFHWPQGVDPGQKSPDFVMTTDLYNSFATLLGSDKSTRDGVNLTAMFRGESLPTRSLYWHHPHYSPQRDKPSAALRCGDYKLIYYFEQDTAAVFDLASDPSEETNVAENNPRLRDSLLSLMTEWQQEISAVIPAKNPAYDPEAN